MRTGEKVRVVGGEDRFMVGDVGYLVCEALDKKGQRWSLVRMESRRGGGWPCELWFKVGQIEVAE